MTRPQAPNATVHLNSLVGKTIETYSGKPNRILQVTGPEVIVGTNESPKGQGVPIEWVQDGIDLLYQEGEVQIGVPTLGHRGAFVAAVLLTLPGTRRASNPSRVVLDQ